MRQIHGGIPFPAGSGDLGHRVCIMRFRLLIVSLLALSFAPPTEAGIFRKTKKPDPATYVPEPITTLKTDKDERARSNAASELSDYDGKVFPDILPALIDALATDTSSSVRSEAAESIGKIRPITSKAGYALEQTVANDKSPSVRVSARMALLKYRVLGFIGVSKADMPVAQTKEPPLAKPMTPIPPMISPIIKPIPQTTPSTTPPPIVPPLTNVQAKPMKSPEPSVILPPVPVVPKLPTMEEEKLKPIPALVIPPVETPKTMTEVELPVPPIPTNKVPKVEGPSLGAPPK
jgi:hypothetical protein